MPDNTPVVSYIRPEVVDELDKWSMIRDCLAGQKAVKLAGDKYLPRPNAEDKSKDNQERYAAYLLRAVFYNVTRRTLDGLVGQVFMREPEYKLPEVLSPLFADADGAGVGLNAQAKKALADTMSFGRMGLLVDYPERTAPATKAELDQGYVRPTIVLYQPDQIINWRTITVGAKKLLSLVVIQELFEAQDDGFQVTYARRWRVLRLEGSTTTDAGTYVVEVWEEQEDNKGEKNTILAQRFVPLDGNGKAFKEIPFTFIGAINNDPIVDQAPLYDLSVLNIAHYRNSADYEEACFIVGQPTLFAAGLTEHWATNVLKGTVQLGSRALLMLPENANAGILQVSPNSMPKEAMETKERQMVALGARLVEQRNVQRTLGEAQIEETGETSILCSVAKNVTEAYQHALTWAMAFAGGTATPEEMFFKLNTDFIAASLTPEERAQLVAEWQAGAIGYSEMRAVLRKGGVATLEDEEAKDESEGDQLRMGPKLGANPGNSLTGGTNNGRSTPRQNGKTQ